MDLRVFDPVELVAVARALRDITLENGVFTEAERDFVEGVARLHGVVLDAQALRPITLAELSAAVRDPHKRKRAVQLAMVASLIEGVPGDATEHALDELARALDVTDAGTRVVREIAHGHVTLARLDMGRRLGAALFHERPLMDLARTVLAAVGLTDESLAERYRSLGRYEPGTLGRALFDHYREHGFPLPGEEKGAPERIIFHDVGHVLSGYGVDPRGEIQQAAFQAGFMRHDGFVFFLFGVLQFHIGIKITPIAEGEHGYFDVKKVLRAAERGAACNVDLTHDWDLWDVAHIPVDELRRRYAIPDV
jgi:hypothetical protein